MIIKAFALYDTKGGMFHTPFFMHHIGMAIRACVDLASDMNTTVGRHPNDFALYEIGAYDDATGTMASMPPNNLGLVGSFLPERPAHLFPFNSVEQAAAIARPNGHAGEA